MKIEEGFVEVPLVEYLRVGIPSICPKTCGLATNCKDMGTVCIDKLKELSLGEVILKKDVWEALNSTI